MKGFEKLKNRVYHKEPLSKYLESGLWELRIKSETNILRVIYTYKKGRKKTAPSELGIARKRLEELKMREEFN